jgi:hypothetical protein
VKEDAATADGIAEGMDALDEEEEEERPPTLADLLGNTCAPPPAPMIAMGGDADGAADAESKLEKSSSGGAKRLLSRRLTLRPTTSDTTPWKGALMASTSMCSDGCEGG